MPGHRRLAQAGFVIGALAVTAPLALAALPATHATKQSVGLTTDLGSRPLFDLTKMRPGVATSRCVAVDARDQRVRRVALYASTKLYPLDRYLGLLVIRGQGAGISCSGFRPDPGGVLFAGTMRQYPRRANRAIVDKRTIQAGRRRVYEFTVAVANDSRAQGLHSAVSFSFTVTRR